MPGATTRITRSQRIGGVEQLAQLIDEAAHAFGECFISLITLHFGDAAKRSSVVEACTRLGQCLVMLLGRRGGHSEWRILHFWVEQEKLLELSQQGLTIRQSFGHSGRVVYKNRQRSMLRSIVRREIEQSMLRALAIKCLAIKWAWSWADAAEPLAEGAMSKAL